MTREFYHFLWWTAAPSGGCHCWQWYIGDRSSRSSPRRPEKEQMLLQKAEQMCVVCLFIHIFTVCKSILQLVHVLTTTYTVCSPKMLTSEYVSSGGLCQLNRDITTWNKHANKHPYTLTDLQAHIHTHTVSWDSRSIVAIQSFSSLWRSTLSASTGRRTGGSLQRCRAQLWTNPETVAWMSLSPPQRSHLYCDGEEGRVGKCEVCG